MLDQPDRHESPTHEDEAYAQAIADARAGCPRAFAQLVEQFRQYLLLVASRELDNRIRSKAGASDLVQETLLAAQQAMGRFEGSSEGELRFWLRQILLNKVLHVSRAYLNTAKRDVRREQNLGGLSDSFRGHLSMAIDAAPTPQHRAIAKEQEDALEETIRRLPEHYRQVIVQRSLERKTFVEIGAESGISADAARKRWCEAISYLREAWKTGDESR